MKTKEQTSKEYTEHSIKCRNFKFDETCELVECQDCLNEPFCDLSRLITKEEIKREHDGCCPYCKFYLGCELNIKEVLLSGYVNNTKL